MECNSQTCAFWIPLKARQKEDINPTTVHCCPGLMQRGKASSSCNGSQQEQTARAASKSSRRPKHGRSLFPTAIFGGDGTQKHQIDKAMRIGQPEQPAVAAACGLLKQSAAKKKTAAGNGNQHQKLQGGCSTPSPIHSIMHHQPTVMDGRILLS